MGFRFRKSIKIGPVRVNLSKSGIGYSVGTKGARISKSAKGKTRVTAGIAGTGLTFSKTVGSKKKSKDKRKQATNAKTNTGESAKDRTNQTATTDTYTPIKKSWFMAIVMAILSFVAVGIVSFVILLILCLIASLFIRDSWSTSVARFVVFGIPIILGILSGFVAFCATKPENSLESTESTTSTEKDDVLTAKNQILHNNEGTDCHSEAAATCATVVQDGYFERKNGNQSKDEYFASCIAQFNEELQAIPKVDVPLSAPAERHLLKNMPQYDFSNITRKTRLDSIFPLVVLDVETTGLYPSKHEIIEVSAIKFDTGMVPIACFTTFCKPKNPIPSEATAINHITDDMVADAPSFAQIAPALSNFIQGNNVVGHNLDFDLRFIFAHGADLPEGKRFYDTLDLAQLTIPKSQIDNYKLETLCSYYGVWRENSHNSLSDCYATSKILSHLVFDKTDRRLDAAPDDASDSDA